MRHTPPGPLFRIVRAFTLIEMLVAVAAVALIAVGLGKLFSSTGQTIQVGKRISYLNEVAATLERQIRADLSALTRDGFLVIRNRTIVPDPNNPSFGPYLSADDRNPAPRIRRADELVFFVNGHFTSSREPQWPGRSPSGSAARIYIGHGMRLDPADYASVTLASDPLWSRLTSPNSGWAPDFGQPGPNRYAGDWILLRQVTALTRPQTTTNVAPQSTAGLTVPPYLQGNLWKDSKTQISLQPAIASIFRFDPIHLNAPDILGGGFGTPAPAPPNGVTIVPLSPGSPPAQNARLGDTPAWNSSASGEVDVASGDLPLFRTRVIGMPDLLQTADSAAPSANNRLAPPKLTLTPNGQGGLQTLGNSAHAMKMLMASAFPGNDPWLFKVGGVATPTQPVQQNQPEQRMLCAALPPDFTGTLTNSGQAYAANQPYRQQDQAMLSASNLVVGCSELIVEWSFGDVYPANNHNANDPRTGQIIWHGLYRPSSGEAVPPAPYRESGSHIATAPWNGNGLGYDAAYTTWRSHLANGQQVLLSHPIYPGLIHWPADIATQAHDGAPLYSFFGYLDPTFDPQAEAVAELGGLSRADLTAVTAGAPPTLDWPWPRLLRFTVSLTDPADHTVEQTYQFIVDISGAQQAQ